MLQQSYWIISNKIFNTRKLSYPIETILKQKGDIACLCTLNLTWVHKSKDAREFSSLEIANRSGRYKLEFGQELINIWSGKLFRLTY